MLRAVLGFLGACLGSGLRPLPPHRGAAERWPGLHAVAIVGVLLVGVWPVGCTLGATAEPTPATPAVTSPATPVVTTAPTAAPTSTPTIANAWPSPSQRATPSPVATKPAGGTPVTNEAVTRAKQDLSRRLGIPEHQITVERVEAVEWPDTSLGCPQPGMMYAQVITPGYRIILKANNQISEYHADRSGRVVYCPNPRQ